MTHLMDDLYLDADEYQLILQRRKVTGSSGRGSHLTKAENIGKERFETIGYYATLEAVLRAVLNMKTRELVQDGASDLTALTKGMYECIDLVENASRKVKEVVPHITMEE